MTFRKRALLIGINNYDKLSSLRFCENDVYSVKNHLIRFADFDERDIFVLTDQENKNRPSLANILEAIKKLPVKYEKYFSLFYFSGHGISDRNGNDILLPADATLADLNKTGISISYLMKSLIHINTEQSLLILDACREMVNIDEPMESNFGNQIPEIISDRAIVIQSCASDQCSIEDEEYERGIFSYFFTKALSGEAANEINDSITIEDILKYVSAKVPSRAKTKYFTLQTPIPYQGKSYKNIVLVDKSKQMAEIKLMGEYDNITVFVDGTQYCENTTLPVVFNVPSGSRQIVIQHANFPDYAMVIHAKAGGCYIVKVTFPPGYGDILLKTLPVGADIKLGGVYQGVTTEKGLYIKEIALGDYKVVVEKSGYKIHQDTIRLNERKLTRIITLTPILISSLPIRKDVGYVCITTDPAGVEVFCNNRLIGTTPIWSRAMKFGKLKLYLKSRKYIDQKHIMEIKRGIVAKQHYIFEPAYGTLLFMTDIPSLHIYIDGEYVALSEELKITKHLFNRKRYYKYVSCMEVNKHILLLRYNNWLFSRDFRIRKKQRTKIKILRSKLLGKITILSHQMVKRLTLNGYAIQGETPVTIDDLPENLYEIYGYKYERKVFTRYFGKCQVKHNKTTVVRLNEYEKIKINMSEKMLIKSHTDDVDAIAFSPDGRFFVSAGWDDKINIYKLPTFELFISLKSHHQEVHDIKFSPCGRYFITVGHWHEPKIWMMADILSGKYRSHSSLIDKLPDARMFSVAYSPNGKYIATGDGHGTLKIWDAETEEILNAKATTKMTGTLGFRWHVHQDGISSILFTADSETIISASLDGTIKVWDIVSGELKRKINQESDNIEDQVYCIAPWIDNNHFIAGFYGGFIKIYNWITGDIVNTTTVKSHEIRTLSLSPNKLLFASGNMQGEITLWDTINLDRIINYKEDGHRIFKTTFSHNYKLMAASMNEGRVKIYRLQWQRE